MATNIEIGVGGNEFSTLTNYSTQNKNSTAVYGLRQFKFPFMATSRAYADASSQPNYTDPMYESVVGRWANGSSSATGFGDIESWVVVGVSTIHGSPNASSPYMPIFFGEFSDFYDDAVFIETLLSLPYFKPVNQGGFGNTPTSTTDRDTLVLQIYAAGMWILRDGMLPPINVDCQLNYQFDFADSWDGSIDVNDWRGTNLNLSPGTIGGTNLGWQNWTGPWCGVLDFNAAAHIEVQNDLGSQSGRSFEWIGQRTGTGSRYIYDARNGSGRWLLTEYQGYQYNWNGQLLVNIAFPNNAPQQKHHGIVTANSSTNVSTMYYGSQLGYNGIVGTGTANTNLTNIGSDLVIGARYTISGQWPGEMAMFRIWSRALSEAQANICWFHEESRVGIIEL